MAGASLQARASNPWANAAGRAGSSLLSPQPPDPRTVTSWREAGPAPRGFCVASGLSHFRPQCTDPAPPVLNVRGSGRSTGLLTVELDPDWDPVPGLGGDKGCSALSLYPGVPALDKLLLSRKAVSSPGCLGCAELSVCQTGRPSGKQRAHAEGSLEGGLRKGTAHKGMAGRVPLGGVPGSGHWVWRQRVSWFWEPALWDPAGGSQGRASWWGLCK